MSDNAALGKIVGSDNVLDDQALLEGLSSDLSFAPPVRPRCVVRAGNSGEIQQIVKWANETRTPLVPVSSGPPHFRGDTVPSAGGAVVVDLSRMKEILRVDRRNRVCMVEPGVTFGELVPILRREGLRLNLPLLPRSSKSVIGSMLEREPVTMPLFQWDVIDPLGCIELVFGTGDLFRTGTAAGPGTLEEQWKSGQAQVNPMGPGQTDFARVVQGSQGTMGIVTWATIRCEAVPTLQEPFLVGTDSLERLSDLTYRLLWLKIVDECLLLNSSSLAAIVATDPEEYISIRDGLPSWLLFLCLAGYQYLPEERLEYQKKGMAEAAKRLGMEPAKAVSGVSAYELLRIIGNHSDQPHWGLRRKGACQDIFFVTTLDKVPGFIEVMSGTAEQCGYPSSDVGVYIQPMVQGTSCHCEFSLFYDPNDAREATRIKELYSRASEALINAGAFFSRPYGEWADLAYRRDGESVAALRKVKSILDPHNVMNSGKLCF